MGQKYASYNSSGAVMVSVVVVTDTVSPDVLVVTTGTFVKATGITAWINENYINSSPPYNLGEAFVYVAYDKDSKIVGISAALDPTWAHHGPHSIVPATVQNR